MQLRAVGQSGLQVTPIAMGCWPIAGMTSLDVTERDSIAAIEAALDSGVNFFDTAYCYGREGESEKLLRRVLAPHRDRVVIATKGGLEWGPDGKQVRDASPGRIRQQCDESLRRLGAERLDVLYLHAPDPQVPVAESAGAYQELLAAGKIRAVGVSNVTVAQLDEFSRVCPIAVCQMPYNLLQREIEADVLPWCRDHNVALAVYWPLLKGLLAGKLPRDFVFRPGDGRAKYPMFQGQEWQRNQDLLDALRPIAKQSGRTMSQLVLAWTVEQSGITAALVGAKRGDQMLENAGGPQAPLSSDERVAIEAALAARGQPLSRGAVL